MEMGETATEGAQREAWEEARARIAIDGVHYANVASKIFF